MQPLNAIDAIAPAFTRTHETLFKPFRFGRSWKLAASSYLSWVGSMFLPFPLLFLLLPHSFLPGSGLFRNMLLAINIAGLILTFVILYFCGRMELVAFEMIVTRQKFIAPMWRRYASRIWPWLGLKVLIGTVAAALLAAVFVAPLRHLTTGILSSMPALDSIPHGTQPDPEAVQALFAPFMAQWVNLQLILVSIAFLLKIPSTLLNDFVLPFYVLEPISLTAALRRGLDVFLADPLQVLLYLILKPILFVIGYIMQSIALGVASIPLILVFAVGAAIAAVAMPHTAGRGVLFVAAAVAYLAFAALVVYVTLFVTGYLIALLEAYGIYFLAGRYPLLADMLSPGIDRPFTPPPVFPSQDERRNSGGGPPLPMDPAVA